MFVEGTCPPLEADLALEADLDRVLSGLNENEPHFLLVIYPAQENKEPRSPLAEAWREVIRLPYIPYDLAQRKTQLAHAYESLAPYIDYWEKTKAEESA